MIDKSHSLFMIYPPALAQLFYVFPHFLSKVQIEFMHRNYIPPRSNSRIPQIIVFHPDLFVAIFLDFVERPGAFHCRIYIILLPHFFFLYLSPLSLSLSLSLSLFLSLFLSFSLSLSNYLSFSFSISLSFPSLFTILQYH